MIDARSLFVSWWWWWWDDDTHHGDSTTTATTSDNNHYDQHNHHNDDDDGRHRRCSSSRSRRDWHHIDLLKLPVCNKYRVIMLSNNHRHSIYSHSCHYINSSRNNSILLLVSIIRRMYRV